MAREGPGLLSLVDIITEDENTIESVVPEIVINKSEKPEDLASLVIEISKCTIMKIKLLIKEYTLFVIFFRHFCPPRNLR